MLGELDNVQPKKPFKYPMGHKNIIKECKFIPKIAKVKV
jgi:hypothetical protein